MISSQQRQPPGLPPSRSKKSEQERQIQLQGTCNRVLKDLITIEGGSITTLGTGTIPFVLLMLMIEGGSGTTIDIFFRCFVDKKGMETKLKRRLHLFLFHVFFIRKGMRTYDYYILAMREKNQFTVMDPFDELDSSSDESSDFDSPESPRQTLISKFMCKKEDETSVEEDMRLMRCVVSGLADRSTLIAVTELLFDGRSRIVSGPNLTFIGCSR
ncbi:hypothetical protein F2Q69_00043925 [Brassica cretica]|uniref:Uncharacterized protein n=1 Tax=Brassica cretica TaxID=69181 RepID=A0A8S9NKC9_BRACR|nr:hypothetical protein F2Q69_00043925 [Brassica cretica]